MNTPSISRFAHIHKSIEHTSNQGSFGLIGYMKLFWKICGMVDAHPMKFGKMRRFTMKIGFFFLALFKSLLYFYSTREFIKGDFAIIGDEVTMYQCSRRMTYILFWVPWVSWSRQATVADLIRLKIVPETQSSDA